jgi:tetratricopeptide (TPR) repeat protein
MSVRSRWKQAFYALFTGFSPGPILRLGSPLLFGAALMTVPLLASAQDPPTPKKRAAAASPRSPEQIERQKRRQEHKDFAGVYFDRVPPADPKMRLRPGGDTLSKAYATYYLGLLKEGNGDIAGAVDYYAEVFKLNPAATALAARAAFLAGQYGEIEKGQELLEGNLAANPDSPFSHLALADYIGTYLADNEQGEQKALAVAQNAYKKFPQNPKILERLVLMLVSWDKTRQAEDILDRALARDADDPEYWLALGKIAQHVWPMPEPDFGAPVLINRIYEKALAAANDDPHIAEAVADFYQASGQDALAEPLYRNIIDDDPLVIDPYEKLARVYLAESNQRLQEAADVLSDLLDHHPRLPATQRLIATIYDEMANTFYEESQAAVAAKNPDLARSLLDKFTEQLNHSIHHYEQALRISRGDDHDYLYTGNLMVRANRHEDATELFQRGLFHYPDSVLLTKWLAMTHSFNEEYETALPIFGKTIELANDQGEQAELNDTFYFQFGACHERLKDFDQAGELFLKAIDLIPAEAAEAAEAELGDRNRSLLARITNYLGYMWVEQNMNLDEAGELIRRANSLDPDNGAYVDSLGWYHFMKGEYSKAMTELLRAEVLINNEGAEPDPVIHDHIAQASYHAGHHERALEHMKQAVALDPDNEEFKERLIKYKKTLSDPKPPPKPAKKKPKAA